MKPATSWSVKGIDSSAREAAKRAAHERGMTLGQWMNELILQQSGAAAESAKKAPKRAARTASRRKTRTKKADSNQDISSKLDMLAEQLRALTQCGQDTAVGRFAPPSMQEAQAMANVIARIEHNEAATEQALEAIGARLDELSRQIAEGGGARGFPEKPEDVPGYAELEAALRNVVDHLEISETRTSETLKTIQERLNAIAAQAGEAARLASEKNDDEDQSEALLGLERRLEDLTARMEAMRGETDERVRAYVDKNMETLAERVDAVHMASQTLPGKVESMVSEVTGEKLGQVEERIGSMVSHLRGKLEEMASGALDVERISSQVDSLSHKLDEVSRRAASADDVNAMRAAIDQLSTAVDGKADRSELAALDERLRAAMAQMEAERAEGGYLPQISALEAKVSELEAAMREAAASSAPAETISVLEGHIGVLDSRLKEAEERLAHIPVLESSIAQLTSSLEASAEHSRKAAEEAAMRIASETAGAPAMDIPDHSGDIQALRDGLEAIKATAASSDARTQETLSAVHETLAHIIEKVGALEEKSKAAAQAAPQAAAEAAPQAAPLMDQPVMDQPDMAMAGQPDAAQPGMAQPGADMSMDPLAQQNAGLDDFAAQAAAAAQTAGAAASGADLQEPDTSSFGAIPPMPGAGEPAAPEMGQLQTPGMDNDAAIKEDFIAAARRAAMAASAEPAGNQGKGVSSLMGRLRGKKAAQDAPSAAQDPSAVPLPGSAPLPGSGAAPGMAAGEEDKSAKKGRFSLSFLNRGKGKTSGDEKAKGDDGGKRKRLVLAGLVLLMAASAFIIRGHNSAPAPQPAAPAITAPAPQDQGAPAAKPDVKKPAPVDKAKGQKHTQLAPGASLEERLAAIDATLAGKPAGGAAAPTGGKAASGVTTASLGSIAANPAQAGLNGPRAKAAIPQQIGTAALRMAASNGDPKAQFVIASHYLEGRAVKRDFFKAAQWYAKAAAKGLAPAQYRLGTLYERGRGLPRDAAQAKVWYEKAAQAGNVKAMHNLAVILANNSAGGANYTEAARWFEAAARHGLRDSQYNLAVLYQRGLGVKKDFATAYKWYAIAARSGDMDARQRVASLKNYLKPETLAMLNKAVEHWQPEVSSKPANFVTIDKPEWRIQSASAKSHERLGAQGAAKAAHTDKPLSRAEMIKRLQTLLGRMGYDAGPADGKMGNRTANAIRLFQLQSGLPVNGQPSMEVLQRLEARAGRGAPSA